MTGSFLRAKERAAAAPCGDMQLSSSSGGAVHGELPRCRRRRYTPCRCRHLLFYVICLCGFLQFLLCLISPIRCKIFKFHDVLEPAAYVLCHVVYGCKGIDCACVSDRFQKTSVLIVMCPTCSWLLPPLQALFPGFSKLKRERILFRCSADDRSTGID